MVGPASDPAATTVDSDVTRRIMVFDGNHEAIELSGDHARQLARALIAAADEVDRCATR